MEEVVELSSIWLQIHIFYLWSILLRTWNSVNLLEDRMEDRNKHENIFFPRMWKLPSDGGQKQMGLWVYIYHSRVRKIA